MKIHGLVVSVDYADLLAVGGPLMAAGLDGLTIVTCERDRATIELARSWGTKRVFCTEAFYANGATFNKGAALSHAVEAGAVPWEDWILHFDADVVPPARWRMILEQLRPIVGRLYGARRELERGIAMEQEIPGYFQLWHTSDPRARRRPLYDIGWKHAGGYDSVFEAAWPRALKTWLPFTVRHLGEPGQNWWGRGNHAKMAEMLERRAAAGGIAEMERF